VSSSKMRVFSPLFRLLLLSAMQKAVNWLT